MNRKERIHNLLIHNFKESSIEVIDNSYMHKGHNNFDGNSETHIKIIIKLDCYQKINKLNIHRKINQLLKEEFENGLHSLEIKIN